MAETTRGTEISEQQRLAQEAGRVGEQLKSHGKALLNEEKSMAADTVAHIAEALRRSESYLREQQQKGTADYVGRTSDYLARMAADLRDRDLDRIVQRARDLAKEQPAVFFGAAIVSGLLVGRIFRSTAEVEFAERGQEFEFEEQIETGSDIYLAGESEILEDVEIDLQGTSVSKDDEPFN
jgi:predicted ATPase